MTLIQAQLAAIIDSINLRLDASESDIECPCLEAAVSRFACIMLYAARVPLAVGVLTAVRALSDVGTTTRLGTLNATAILEKFIRSLAPAALSGNYCP